MIYSVNNYIIYVYTLFLYRISSLVWVSQFASMGGCIAAMTYITANVIYMPHWSSCTSSSKSRVVWQCFCMTLPVDSSLSLGSGWQRKRRWPLPTYQLKKWIIFHPLSACYLRSTYMATCKYSMPLKVMYQCLFFILCI